MSQPAERQAQRLCVGHSARERDGRGVSIWAELRMGAGGMLKTPIGAEAEFVTEQLNNDFPLHHFARVHTSARSPNVNPVVRAVWNV